MRRVPGLGPARAGGIEAAEVRRRPKQTEGRPTLRQPAAPLVHRVVAKEESVRERGPREVVAEDRVVPRRRDEQAVPIHGDLVAVLQVRVSERSLHPELPVIDEDLVAGRKQDVIGVAVALGDQIQSADIYASSALFRELWPKLVKAKKGSKSIPRDAVRKPRPIQWQKLRKTPVYDGEKLAIGNRVKGPAIVETSDTTVVVHPGRTLAVDPLGNFEITFK